MTTTWAERIEEVSEAQQRNLGFGPFFVHEGRLTTMLDLVRTRSSTEMPAPWPIDRAPGWLTHRLDDDWSETVWCPFGGEWAFTAPTSARRRVVHVPSNLDASRYKQISARLGKPSQLIAEGDAFPFCDEMFIIPDEPFYMN